MKQALILLLLAALMGVGLRYVFPKERINPKEEIKHVDELLAVVLEEEESKEEGKGESEYDTATLSQTKLVVEEKEKPIAIKKPSQQPQKVKGEYLSVFFDKLYALEQKKKEQVRIAVFGDSMLDADMLVMQFRHYLQKRFGGLGVGFVPITSVSAPGRYSIKHSFSSNWGKQTFLRKKDTIFPFGVNGEVFFIGDTASVQKASVTFRRGGAYRELPLINPKLFYGKRRSYDSVKVAPIIVSVKADSLKQKLDLKGDKSLNSVSLPNGAKKLILTVEDSGTLPLYGVSFASQNGVIVDNLAVRGNSGLPISRLKTNLMRAFDSYFDYDLIILSYGTNVFNPDYEKGYDWYGRRMQRVVEHLRNCFSGADFIVVSMADRAVKIDEEMQTPKGLPDFVKVEQNIADSTQSAFFSMYDAMGGAGSMRTWVETEPPLANKDYTHFNAKGAEKAAGLFYDWLMQQYEKYIKEKIALKEEKKLKEDSVMLNVENVKKNVNL